MNYRKIYNVLGSILLLEAVLLVLPVMVSVVFREGFRTALSFLITMALLGAAGGLMKIKKPEKESIYARDGYMLVALTWLFMSAFGALPFVISGAVPNYINAFFETVSGFTTTGSTILTAIEPLPKSILFWRSFTHFIGGMGILVFAIAILPKTEGSAMHIMRAEVPGPSVGKLVSRLRASARILYAIYIGMTLVLILLLFAGKMPLFDSICTAFATAGTGGFSVLNNSIEGYHNPYCEVVLAVFMVLYGVNFNLYYISLKGHIRHAIKDEELRWYLGTIFAATLIITLELTVTRHHFGHSLRLAFFQVSSIISTTGFTTTDFDSWPTLARIILLLLMFLGACAGSTGGGLKISRVAILVKSAKRAIKKAFNPGRIEGVKMDGKSVEEDLVTGVVNFLVIYVIVIFISVFIIAIDGHDMITSMTSVITCINNVGPAFSEIGPYGNFAALSDLSKLVLTFDMLAGRLELIPMFMIFSKYIIPRKYA
ncbi:MAG: TrkH family potassium uptake protein [Clostridia bacterium]|nr:TrkH family potassium uptake protein [Clostridia bacterium]